MNVWVRPDLVATVEALHEERHGWSKARLIAHAVDALQSLMLHHSKLSRTRRRRTRPSSTGGLPTRSRPTLDSTRSASTCLTTGRPAVLLQALERSPPPTMVNSSGYSRAMAASRMATIADGAIRVKAATLARRRRRKQHSPLNRYPTSRRAPLKAEARETPERKGRAMKPSSTSIDFTPAEREAYEERQRRMQAAIERMAAAPTLEESQQIGARVWDEYVEQPRAGDGSRQRGGSRRRQRARRGRPAGRGSGARCRRGRRCRREATPMMRTLT